MTDRWIQVPDWFSWENQGADLALADLDGDGRPDLVVLMVDNPPGQNRGFYRVGRSLDAAGSVTGGWTPWLEVPGWFSNENQGAGVAVGDLNGDGSAELVVLMVDNPPFKNQGKYRIGRKLDGDGNVNGGWTPWLDVPDWSSWENQGAALTLTPPDAQGKRDLIVFMTDNPIGDNHGKYRIARGLDVLGNATGGWTEWKEVPEWFFQENRAAGVAVVDLDNDGGRDLVVFHVADFGSHGHQNQAFFRYGRDLAGDGTVEDNNWSPWYGVPSWFSWENQGGGIAAADLDPAGSPSLLALMVDNPPQQNSGRYQLIPLRNDPAVQGEWKTLPYNSQVLAVHAALLHTGKVLFSAGSGNSSVRFNARDFGNEKKKFWVSVVWDPQAPMNANFVHPDTPRRDGKVIDFFCGGESFLADGSLLAAGGTRHYDVNPAGLISPPGFQGRTDTLTFDPIASQWKAAADMADGRWYPTLVTLQDGRVLVAAGLIRGILPEFSRNLEVFTPDGGQGAWRTLPVPTEDIFPRPPLYPHLFLTVGGRVCFTGGRMDDGDIDLGPCLIDLTTDPIALQPITGLSDAASRNQSASVLLPAAQDQKVMIMGGATATGEDNATDSTAVAGLLSAHPSYQPAAPMLLPRVHLNAVLLPDRTVFVGGGGLQREGGDTHHRRANARYQCEIYDPETDSWTLGAPGQFPRLYHSVALLLPDGRVVVASGNPDKGHQVAWEPQDANEELHLEIYSPPYCAGRPRPIIDAVEESWAHEQEVAIRTPAPGEIRWASLIKSGVTTHSFNTGQRLVDLPITGLDQARLTVAVTADPSIAPPGWYMLFLTDHARTPSVARWIHLG